MAVKGDKKRSPEEIESWRQELLQGGKTLQQIGDREEISRERVRQLVGNLNRHHPPDWKRPEAGRAEENRTKVRVLFTQGLNDSQIAERLSIAPRYVKRLRSGSGMRRTFAHSPEHDIWCAQKWHELFGYTPTASDWEPFAAKELGHYERAERFQRFREEYGCPTKTGILKRHGNWLKFIAKTGLPRAPRGGASHGRHKVSE